MLGTYQLASKQSFCEVCPPGYFCENAVSKLQKCPSRYFCTERTKVPSLCPNGTYSYDNETGLEKDTDCRPCIAGHFCIMGKSYFSFIKVFYIWVYIPC